MDSPDRHGEPGEDAGHMGRISVVGAESRKDLPQTHLCVHVEMIAIAHWSAAWSHLICSPLDTPPGILGFGVGGR